MFLSFPRLLEVIDLFKKHSESKSCEVLKNSDVISRGKVSHNFIWIRGIYPSTFKSITGFCRNIIRERGLYKSVDINYVAWLCEKPPFKSIKQVIEEKPEILKKNAVYDFSHIHKDRACDVLNETNCEVFKLFEEFLQEKFGAKCNLVDIPKLEISPKL